MTTHSPISVLVNDQAVETPAGSSIPALLEQLNLRPDRVVVEYNGQAQTRHESAQTELKNGDRLEVIRIVAGG